ncbi:S49 family peptidase [Chthonobacter albigriseus]|uniref:S49 family peptidase n=1 Tax=Chthonobacter albigriseus TaxID=1683161 RepID=UPI0031402768
MLDRLKSLLPARFRDEGPVVPVVRLSGAIGIGTPFRPGLSLAAVSHTLERAFSMKKAPAVALVINSPGGSPVQSHLIFKRIRQLAAEKEKPVIAYVEDVAASGGYMIACAADEIVADPASIVGSIGVVSASFGLDRFIERHGIDRRVYTSGTRKVTLDPFQPENAEDVDHLKSLQRDIHRMFIDLVTERRGANLSASEDLFSGLFWTGEAGRALGLVDRTGDVRSDLKARFGDKTKLRLVSRERGFLRRRSFGIDEMIGGLGPLVSAEEALSAVEIRALYARYGL